MLHTEFSEVSLDIAGRNYKLKTPQHQQQGLQEAAALLNEKIAELKRKSRTLSAEQAAVLAALNLSYELLTERELLAQDRQHIFERLAQLQQKHTKSIPVLLLSNQTDFHSYLSAVRVGAIGYFGKPLNTTELEARLRQQVASKGRHRRQGHATALQGEPLAQFILGVVPVGD